MYNEDINEIKYELVILAKVGNVYSQCCVYLPLKGHFLHTNNRCYLLLSVITDAA